MFITLEGSEGSGKTTHVSELTDYLRKEGYTVMATREPGGTAIGDQVRAILSGFENTAMIPRTEILLFLASRAQLVEQVIRPHLAAGEIVLSDRFADSTLAYQGYGHGEDLQRLKVLVDFATGGLKPDLTLLLDVDIETGLHRRSQDGGWNRLDAYPLEFHERTRQGFLQLATEDPGRWVVIDANQSLEHVQLDIRQVVLARLKERKRSER